MEAYKNTELPVKERVADLISRMTLKEKVSQMSSLAPAIKRLGLEAYGPNLYDPLAPNGFSVNYSKEEIEKLKKLKPWKNLKYWENGDCMDGGWWNEALHGVAESGYATVFPQSIGVGCTWDPQLLRQEADAISDEARVHHEVYNKKLTFWSPVINIQRDPRWGRDEESYSEDPYLLSKMAVAFVKGLQGDNPKYLKAISTPKHFVANNSEFNRHTGSFDIKKRWLREYYFPAFGAAVEKGGAFSVMGAYNSLNGVPVCANDWLLNDVLRKQWGFKGYVVSDCGAISDIVKRHKYETDPEKAVAMAVKAGTDLECETCESEQFMYDKYLYKAAEKGYISEKDIDKAVTRLFTARFLLGEFDPPSMVPYSNIPRSSLDSPEHRNLALKVARESMVLLKNKDHILPLNKNSINTIAVIGPNADEARLGDYTGTPVFRVTPLEGIREKAGPRKVYYVQGSGISDSIEGGIRRAVDAARRCGTVILVLGTDGSLAHESKDRKSLGLIEIQIKLAEAVYVVNKNIIVVLENGYPVAINWLNENVPAILEAWYPGQSGGTAIADVLFGDYNPGGKLAQTFYSSVKQLPPIDDYDITKGRTYWFLKDKPLYPFGYGLSYTTFKYSDLKMPENIKNGKEINVSVTVSNTGSVPGDEIVELYVKDIKASVTVPLHKLQNFERIHLKPGEVKTVRFKLEPKQLAFYSEAKKKWIVEPGEFLISVGGRQPVPNENQDSAKGDILFGKVNVTGGDFTTD